MLKVSRLQTHTKHSYNIKELMNESLADITENDHFLNIRSTGSCTVTSCEQLTQTSISHDLQSLLTLQLSILLGGNSLETIPTKASKNYAKVTKVNVVSFHVRIEPQYVKT